MYVACPSAVLGPGEQNQYATADAERAALEGVSLAWGHRGRGWTQLSCTWLFWGRFTWLLCLLWHLSFNENWERKIWIIFWLSDDGVWYEDNLGEETMKTKEPEILLNLQGRKHLVTGLHAWGSPDGLELPLPSHDQEPWSLRWHHTVCPWTSTPALVWVSYEAQDSRVLRLPFKRRT